MGASEARAGGDGTESVKPKIKMTEGGKVVWSAHDPIEIPPDYETPRVATARFHGQVLRALLREGRGEWQVLQVGNQPLRSGVHGGGGVLWSRW